MRRRSPGLKILNSCRIIFSPSTYREVLEPAIRDLQDEYNETAVSPWWKVAWILMRGYYAAWNTILLQACFSLLRRLSSQEVLAQSLLLLPVITIFSFQILDTRWKSGRAIGVTLASRDDTVRVFSTSPGAPAMKGGLRAGDEVIAIDGKPINSIFEYDLAANHFERGTPTRYEVRRNEQILVLHVTPGMKTNWTPVILNTSLVVTLCLGCLLALARRSTFAPSAPALLAFLVSRR